MINHLLNFSASNQVPMIRQSELAECGLACLAMISGFYKKHVALLDLRREYALQLAGMNLQQMIDTADRLDLSSRALKCSVDEVKQLKLPCILHWNMNHFVVLTKVRGNKYFINDPASGTKILQEVDFSKHFTGICLELSPSKGFEPVKAKSKLRFSQLWSSISGISLSLIKLLALSLVLQLFALLSPYYLQWVIDEVLLSYDQSLLTVLALGFAGMTVLSVLTQSLRSWLIVRVASMLNLQLGSNLLRHLIRLPLSFFEARHIGDIVSRFGSLSHIRERISSGIVETVVDALMAISVLVMMMFYSLKLSLIVLAIVLLYALIRFAFYRPLHLANEQLIEHSANEQSHFLESIRGIQTIKLFAYETQRQSQWQNRYAGVINCEIKLGRLNIQFDALNKLLFGLENIIVVFVAAQLVMKNVFTVGMLMAFMAYKGQLTSRIINLIEQIILFKMMRLHLDRISDIALTKPEISLPSSSNTVMLNCDTNAAELELKGISYQLSGQTERCLFKSLNLSVQRGESVVITGASGVGKTTLLKVILGLLPQTHGDIYFAGQKLSDLGLGQYRQQIATVMQDDTLLAGSIAENISFFSESPDSAMIVHCAQLAALDSDINKMTMGYQTLVGDMGSNLSGGQIQRLLLARALYKKPRILFLDEATSHLDQQNEIGICQNLKQLGITTIIIAHRQETIVNADRVFLLEDGELNEELAP